jgi:hypothetical protein
MRNKTSIFSTYALVSVIGFGGFWWFGAKGGESMNAAETFLAFYSFLCTTVVFYVLASQKQSIDHAFDAIQSEMSERGRDVEAAYRYIDDENEKIARRIDSEYNIVFRELERIERDADCSKTDTCCKAL